jgi:membrane protease YdiL (CAAX protease family)
LYLCVALIPALCEEIAFRGVLLHGLRKRLAPAALPIVVGLIFAMFHFTLFRLAPTAFMGMVITTVTLLTGSIFPGMLLHAGNNAFAVWAASNGYSLDLLEWWQYALAASTLALTLYTIYRHRTPYPDLGSAGRSAYTPESSKVVSSW